MNSNQSEQDIKKYKLDDILESLPKRHFGAVKKGLIKALGVSQNTFRNYRQIRIHDAQDIPHVKVVIIERFLGLKSGELCNLDPEVERFKF